MKNNDGKKIVKRDKLFNSRYNRNISNFIRR